VYGGGSIGLMGLVSQAVHDGGRHVIGYTTLFFSYFHHYFKKKSLFSHKGVFGSKKKNMN
jgi:predicted Rossmann-fold nucleotide-binding protein